MLDLVFVAGVVVAFAGVVQSASRRRRRHASTVSLLREGMTGFEGAEAEAFRAEFRRSGVIPAERHPPTGF